MCERTTTTRRYIRNLCTQVSAVVDGPARRAVSRSRCYLGKVGKVKGKRSIAVSNYLTATGTHVPHGITWCYLPPDGGDIPALTPTEAGTRPTNMEAHVINGTAKLVGRSVHFITSNVRLCRCKLTTRCDERHTVATFSKSSVWK